MTNDPSKAAINPSIVIPSIKFSSQKISALSIKVNKPRVRRFMGSVRSARMGLTVIFRRAKRKAAKKAVGHQELTSIPLTSEGAIKRAPETARNLIIHFI